MPLLTPDQAAGDGATLPTLAETIRLRRAELDITKAEAARRAGVSRRTWHEVEEGTRTTSTAVTLAQFDQALQLEEGTLWRLTADSAVKRAEDLRRQAIELVRSMSEQELEYLIQQKGKGTLIRRLDEMSDELARLRDLHELLHQDLQRERSNADPVGPTQAGPGPDPGPDPRRTKADPR